MKRKIAVNLVAFLLSILLASIVTERPNASFMNTIYTVAGIMFSIGMGIICTFSPDKVKNKDFFLSIRSNINTVRNSFIFYFSLISGGFLLYQGFPDLEWSFAYKRFELTLSISLLTAVLIVISIVYFILNFLAIQQLNLDISERVNGGSP